MADNIIESTTGVTVGTASGDIGLNGASIVDKKTYEQTTISVGGAPFGGQ